MSKSRIRIQVAFLLFILLPATVGVVVIHASATCERFVRTYVTKPVTNRVSKTTADAWAAWRLAHPNWKPKPNSRPKYVMTREEAVQKVNFACSVPTEDSNLDLLFSSADFDGPPPFIQLPPMNTTQINFPDQVPPEVAELGPMPVLPVIPPAFPLVSGAVPEPASLMLVGTGFGFLCLLMAARARESKA
jgi:hypothetical protein